MTFEAFLNIFHLTCSQFRMPVDNYLVFYVPNHKKQTVTVMRVMYGGRDIDRQLNPLL